MIAPAPEPSIEFPSNKTRHKAGHRIVVRDVSRFHVVVIKRDRHITRVAHDIDHSRIMRLKALMALQHSRTGKIPKKSICIEINFWNSGLDVRKRDLTLR